VRVRARVSVGVRVRVRVSVRVKVRIRVSVGVGVGVGVRVRVRVDGAALQEVALHEPQHGRRPPVLRSARAAALAAAPLRLLLLAARARAPPELLRQLRRKGQLVDVRLPDRLDEVVHEDGGDERGEGEDAVVVHRRLPRALEALRVEEDRRDVRARP